MLKPKAHRRRVPGKPDAGNPPVRFDEGWRNESETDNYGPFNLQFISPPTLPFTFMTKQRSFAGLTEEEINQVFSTKEDTLGRNTDAGRRF
jgi:hypothetical protein